MISQITKTLLVLSMSLLLSMPQWAVAASSSSSVVVEEPSALAMTGDLVIARPILLAVTVIGTAVFLVSLPFSLLGGNAGEAGKTLVVGPAVNTFVRCLGCSNPGYKKEIKNTEEDKSDEK